MKKLPSPLLKPPAVPFYEDGRLYNLGGGAPSAREFNGWKAESLRRDPRSAATASDDPRSALDQINCSC